MIISKIFYLTFFCLLPSEFSLSFIITNNSDPIILNLNYLFALLCLNLISVAYIVIKFYKVLCYCKITSEWLPILNPYTWPFSFFQTITAPYFALWAKILPTIKVNQSSMEVSSIIGLEALNAVLYFSVRFFNELIILTKSIENMTN